MIKDLAMKLFVAHAEKTAKGKAKWDKPGLPPSDFPLTEEESVRVILDALQNIPPEISKRALELGAQRFRYQKMSPANVFSATVDAILETDEVKVA